MISEINFKMAEMDFSKIYHEGEHCLKKNQMNITSLACPHFYNLRLEYSDLNILSIKKINNVIMHMIMA